MEPKVSAFADVGALKLTPGEYQKWICGSNVGVASYVFAFTSYSLYEENAKTCDSFWNVSHVFAFTSYSLYEENMFQGFLFSNWKMQNASGA
jgi:hypothetical protein